MTDNDAHDALASIHAVQATAGDAFSKHSWGYDLTYSALVAAFIGAFALPSPYHLVGGGVVAMALGLLALGWARKHGVWISGIKPKRARWIACIIGLVAGGLAVATLFAAQEGLPLFGAPAAVAGFIAALVCSRWWRAVYRRELGLPL